MFGKLFEITLFLDMHKRCYLEITEHQKTRFIIENLGYTMKNPTTEHKSFHLKRLFAFIICQMLKVKSHWFEKLPPFEFFFSINYSRNLLIWFFILATFYVSLRHNLMVLSFSRAAEAIMFSVGWQALHSTTSISKN